MLDIIILLGAGSAITLYFVNAPFRNKLHELGRHVLSLFKSGDTTPTPVFPEPTPVAPTAEQPKA